MKNKMLYRLLQMTLLASLVVITADSAKAALTAADLRLSCQAETVTLGSHAGISVRRGETVEVYLDDLSSRCSAYSSIDRYFGVRVKVAERLNSNISDVMRRSKFRIEVIDLVTGLPLDQVAELACLSGEDIYTSRLTNLSSILRPLKVRFVNAGSRDWLIYPSFQYSAELKFDSYRMCGVSP